MEKPLIVGHPNDDDGYGVHKKLTLLVKENDCKCVFCKNRSEDDTVE